MYALHTYTYLCHGRQSTTTTFVHGKWTYCSPVLLLSAYKKWPPAKNYREVHSAQAHNNIFSFITSYISYISSYIGSHKILSKMQKIWIQDGIQPTNFADCFFFGDLSNKPGSPPSNPSKSREGRRGLLLAFSFGNGGGAATTGYWTRRGTMGLLDLKLRGLVWLHNKLGVVVSIFFMFTPILGKIPILTNICQMGWFNHQVVYIS